VLVGSAGLDEEELLTSFCTDAAKAPRLDAAAAAAEDESAARAAAAHAGEKYEIDQSDDEDDDDAGAAAAGGDVSYGEHLHAHLTTALNSVLAKMPEDPFKAMQKVLFAASLVVPFVTPSAKAIKQTAEQAAYCALYRIQDAIDRLLMKMQKRLTAGPIEGVKFLVSDAGDFFTDESKKLKAQGGPVDLTMTAEELKAKDEADKKAKREKEAKAEAERDAADAINAKKTQEMESSGKKVGGGLHKFDASEVDVHGGNATADDFMDAFGF